MPGSSWWARREALRFVTATLTVPVLLSHPARAAADMTYFRIGTGGTLGTYFPIGGIIANAISNPPGSRPCDKGGSCGVPGLVAVAQSSEGSIDNLEAIAAGRIESGFSQADIAYWAYSGTTMFAARGAMANLRVITNLYRESVQLVARADAGIATV
jgi:TRAP transporter TAXI family solute receptor